MEQNKASHCNLPAITQKKTKAQTPLRTSISFKNNFAYEKPQNGFYCQICQKPLVDALSCTQCRCNFHTTCMNRFLREKGHCLNGCKRPKFDPIKKDTLKKFNQLRIKCSNNSQGCYEELHYLDLDHHQKMCPFEIVKCQAFYECQVLGMRQEIENHQKKCQFIKEQCQFCLRMISRIDQDVHDQYECKGERQCNHCQKIVTKQEILSNQHACLQVLSEELSFFAQGDDVSLPGSQSDTTPQKARKYTKQKSSSNNQQLSNSNDSINNKTYEEEKSSSLSYDNQGSCSSNNLAIEEQIYYDVTVPEEVMKQYLPIVPDTYKKHFMDTANLLESHLKFLKDPNWEYYSRQNTSTMKTRISDRGFICLKSTAYINGNLEDLLECILDFDLKPKYDITFEFGKFIDKLAYETYAVYYKYRRIVFVSPRDMILFGRVHRRTPTDVYLLIQTIELEDYPPVKGIVRSETPLGGWRIKQVTPTECKVQFYGEVDFKIPLFVQKTVGPKSGHLAHTLKQYLKKHPYNAQKK